MSISYTYLLGWSNHNKWYYGCQYNSKAHPNNLWTTYFTSSSYVKKFRETYGEPDQIVVCETFDDSLKAKQWEDEVLLAIPDDQKHYWLNKRFGSFKGIVITDEIRNKMRNKK